MNYGHALIDSWPALAYPRHAIVSGKGGKWTCTACGESTRAPNQDSLAELEAFAEEHSHGA